MQTRQMKLEELIEENDTEKVAALPLIDRKEALLQAIDYNFVRNTKSLLKLAELVKNLNRETDIILCYEEFQEALNRIMTLYSHLRNNKTNSNYSEVKEIVEYYISTFPVWFSVFLNSIHYDQSNCLPTFRTFFRRLVVWTNEITKRTIFTVRYNYAIKLTLLLSLVSVAMIKSGLPILTDDVLEVYKDDKKYSPILPDEFFKHAFMSSDINKYMSEGQWQKFTEIAANYILLAGHRDLGIDASVVESIKLLIRMDLSDTISPWSHFIAENIATWFAMVFNRCLSVSQQSFVITKYYTDLLSMLSLYIGLEKTRKIISHNVLEAISYSVAYELQHFKPPAYNEERFIKYLINIALFTAPSDKVGKVFMYICSRLRCVNINKRYMSKEAIKVVFDKTWLNQFKNSFIPFIMTKRVMEKRRQEIIEFFSRYPWMITNKCFYSHEQEILKKEIYKYNNERKEDLNDAKVSSR